MSDYSSEEESDDSSLISLSADYNGQMRFIRYKRDTYVDGKNSSIVEHSNYVVYNNSKPYVDDNTIINEFRKFLNKFHIDELLNITVNDYPSCTTYTLKFDSGDDFDNLVYYKIKNLVDLNNNDFFREAWSIKATDILNLGFINSDIEEEFYKHKKLCEEFLHNIHESLSPCQKLLRNAELRLPLPIPISISDLPKDPNRLTFLKYDIDYYRLDGNNAQSYNKDSLEEVLKGYDCKNPTTRSIITQIDKIRFISPILPNRSLLPFSSFDSRKRKRSLG